MTARKLWRRDAYRRAARLGPAQEAVNSLSGLLAKGKLTLDDMAQYCSRTPRKRSNSSALSLRLPTSSPTATPLSSTRPCKRSGLLHRHSFRGRKQAVWRDRRRRRTLRNLIGRFTGTLFLRSASPTASRVFSPSLPRQYPLAGSRRKVAILHSRRRSWKLSRNPTSSRLRATLRSSPQPTARRLTRLTQRPSSRASTRSSRSVCKRKRPEKTVS